MVNGFTKKKVGTLTLGEKLKKLRSDKRISLNEVSRVTKIKLEYLECLEEGRYKDLPVDVYVRGFLKSYGDFLLVDEGVLIRLYEKEKGIKQNLEKSKNISKKDSKIVPINISAFVFTPKKIALSIIPIFVFLIFLYLYREVGSLTDTPRLIIFSPVSNLEIKEKSVVLEGRTDKDARVFVNDQIVLVDDDGKFRENLSMQQGINTIHIKAINKFQKEAAENITVQADYEEEKVEETNNQAVGLSESEGSNLEAQAVQIELNVDPGPVWISVEADENLVFSGEMLAGAMQTFTAHDKIVIGSGQANATHIKFNGKDLGTLGPDKGVIKDVVFAKEGKN